MGASAIELTASPTGLPAGQGLFLFVFAIVAGLTVALIYYRRHGAAGQDRPLYIRSELAKRHPLLYGAVTGVLMFVLMVIFRSSLVWSLIIGVITGLAGVAGGYIIRRAQPL